MKMFVRILCVTLLWFLVYLNLAEGVNVLVDHVFGLQAGRPLTEAIRFFLYEFPKIILLLTLIIFAVGIVRTFFTAERTRKVLQGKSMFVGNILAALLGIVTPFCSCSAIPLFLGFVEAGIPLGVTFSFLIAAPMINEVAMVLLFGMFGWKITALYILTGLLVAIVSGWIIGRLRLEHWVEDWVYQHGFAGGQFEDEKPSWSDRIRAGWDSTREIVSKVWLYVAAGILIGAGVHGYVPESFLASLMGKSAWYAVPLSVLIGIPLYSNAAGIVPIVSVLIEKGAAVGTALSFMMSVIALSLPELIILRKVLKLPLILTFVGVVGTGILLVGYLFNMIL